MVCVIAPAFFACGHAIGVKISCDTAQCCFLSTHMCAAADARQCASGVQAPTPCAACMYEAHCLRMPVRDYNHGQYAGRERERYEPWTWTVEDDSGGAAAAPSDFWYPRELGYDTIYKSQIQVFQDTMDLCFAVGVVYCHEKFPAPESAGLDISGFHEDAFKLFNASRRLQLVDSSLAKKRLVAYGTPHLFSSPRHQFAFPYVVLEPWTIPRRGYLSVMKLTGDPIPQPTPEQHAVKPTKNDSGNGSAALTRRLQSWSLMSSLHSLRPSSSDTDSSLANDAHVYDDANVYDDATAHALSTALSSRSRAFQAKQKQLLDEPDARRAAAEAAMAPADGRPGHHPVDYNRYFAEFYNPAMNYYDGKTLAEALLNAQAAAAQGAGVQVPMPPATPMAFATGGQGEEDTGFDAQAYEAVSDDAAYDCEQDGYYDDADFDSFDSDW
ncbi:hypothetical protein BROUX41_000844 [Berkeleyomyces rouxiae]|uniref:uncharacterized protein n=1 Tax=Berkeleyomyces rouxiae TaxID=2035830 RepID=UPI003B802CF7